MFNTFRSLCLAAVTLAVTSNLSLAASETPAGSETLAASDTPAGSETPAGSNTHEVKITARVGQEVKFSFDKDTSNIALNELDPTSKMDISGVQTVGLLGNTNAKLTLKDESRGHLCLDGNIKNATVPTKSIPYTLEIGNGNDLTNYATKPEGGNYSAEIITADVDSGESQPKTLSINVTIKPEDFNGKNGKAVQDGAYSAVLVLTASAV